MTDKEYLVWVGQQLPMLPHVSEKLLQLGVELEKLRGKSAVATPEVASAHVSIDPKSVVSQVKE